MSTDDGPEDRFRRLYADCFDPVLAYALRRSARPEDAADVVAETFLVAWRRLDVVPDGPEARWWLYAVARRTLANQRRGEGRRGALGQRLRDELAGAVPDHAGAVTERAELEAALARLEPRDREVLELAAHEELEPREISVVLGISAVAARTRLSRARRRLARALDDPAGLGPPPPAAATPSLTSLTSLARSTPSSHPQEQS
jgi:RNA polymerase sigma-70 factor (ECF subfamily)